MELTATIHQGDFKVLLSTRNKMTDGIQGQKDIRLAVSSMAAHLDFLFVRRRRGLACSYQTPAPTSTTKLNSSTAAKPRYLSPARSPQKSVRKVMNLRGVCARFPRNLTPVSNAK